ncbi:MAG: hypothetical protein HQK97_06645 [Nitrospirae bacterium]|nr:hypothetical protein [Nitrospirota bacterium]
MKKLALTILIWVLASCQGQKGKNAASVTDSYAGLWGMLVVSKPPTGLKPLKEATKAGFKDASYSKGKGKIAVGTA